jgi:hypothetical protein
MLRAHSVFSLLATGFLSGVRGVPRHGLYDIYCSAHYNQYLLIILFFLAAWRGGTGADPRPDTFLHAAKR